jgi:hypothetical protein
VIRAPPITVGEQMCLRRVSSSCFLLDICRVAHIVNIISLVFYYDVFILSLCHPSISSLFPYFFIISLMFLYYFFIISLLILYFFTISSFILYSFFIISLFLYISKDLDPHQLLVLDTAVSRK